MRAATYAPKTLTEAASQAPVPAPGFHHSSQAYSPVEPLTHWYQVRCLLRSPLAVGAGHTLSGNLRFEANEARGYNVHMTLTNNNTGVSQSSTVVTQCALHHFQYTTQSSAPAWPGFQQQEQPQQQQWQPQAQEAVPATAASVPQDMV